MTTLPNPHLQPASEADARNSAYDLIDRFLRNNLGDADYPEYSEALELVFANATQPSVPASNDLVKLVQQLRAFGNSIVGKSTAAAADELEHLAARCAELEKDAARYRYIRDFPPRARARNNKQVWPPEGDLWCSGWKLISAVPHVDIVEGAELDRRIDAAIAAQSPRDTAPSTEGGREG